jgi:lipopolysaccharide biosynthesis glycosyltransferase
VTGADEEYRLPLAVTISSLLENLSPESQLHLYLLDGGLTPQTRARLSALIDRARPTTRLSWLKVDSREYAHLKVAHREYLSPAAFARLKIPELLPGLDRAIYLDSDVVVHTDLTPLWNVDLQGKAVGAVQDSGIPVVGAQLGIQSHDALGLEPERPYFNSGVLVMDLNAWRKHDIPERALAYLTTYADQLNTCDQEGLNAALCGHWHSLDLHWNVTTEFFNVEDLLPSSPMYEDFRRRVRNEKADVCAAPSIIHFTSSAKPWNGTSHHPMRGWFFHYLRRSGWLSPTAYAVWRTRIAAQGILQSLPERTRGIRQKIGLSRFL